MKTTRIFLISLFAIVSCALYLVQAIAGPIELKTKDGIGSYLTDTKGMALYIFKKDVAGKSNCGVGNGCIEKWPSFYAETVDPIPGVPADAFGMIIREDGKKQTTFRGLPLYYFFKDTAPGDTNGQGFNNVWYLATP